MFNLAEFFGVEASDVFEERQKAEGYLMGCNFATRLLEQFHEATVNNSRAYREAALQALREQI